MFCLDGNNVGLGGMKHFENTSRWSTVSSVMSCVMNLSRLINRPCFIVPYT